MKLFSTSSSIIRRAGVALSLAFCAAAQVQAQDLFHDLHRVINGNASLVSADGSSGFRVGLVEDENETMIDEVLGVVDGLDVIGTSTTFSSAVYWNCTSSAVQISNGTTLPGSSVVMESLGLSTAVEIDMPKDPTNSFTVHTTATSMGSGLGTLVLETLSAGVWTTVFREPMNANRSDTRTFLATHNMRLRWMLEPGTGPMAQAGIQVVITK